MKKGTKYKIWSICNIVFILLVSFIGEVNINLKAFYYYKEQIWNFPTIQILILFSIILWGIGEIVDNTSKKKKEN